MSFPDYFMFSHQFLAKTFKKLQYKIERVQTAAHKLPICFYNVQMFYRCYKGFKLRSK